MRNCARTRTRSHTHILSHILAHTHLQTHSHTQTQVYPHTHIRTNTCAHTHTPTPNGHTTHTNTRTPTSNGPAQPSAEQEVQVTADMGFAANSVRAAFNGLQDIFDPNLQHLELKEGFGGKVLPIVNIDTKKESSRAGDLDKMNSVPADRSLPSPLAPCPLSIYFQRVFTCICILYTGL
mmetsp:Transcript_97751/g.143068  ORF Transcript_97751/g.143068 Transcript_97751/m.143068 type:complete len:179 (-) Transcript_97751:85-621(-)